MKWIFIREKKSRARKSWPRDHQRYYEINR